MEAEGWAAWEGLWSSVLLAEHGRVAGPDQRDQWQRLVASPQSPGQQPISSPSVLRESLGQEAQVWWPHGSAVLSRGSCSQTCSCVGDKRSFLGPSSTVLVAWLPVHLHLVSASLEPGPFHGGAPRLRGHSWDWRG